MQNKLLILPFILQGLCMCFDEFYFHERRGLPRWEKIGHPLDSLTVLACFSFLVFMPPSLNNLAVFIALAVFSCLFITKDEWVHAEKCVAAENWLHAILFMLHPVIFICACWFWLEGNIDPVRYQTGIIALFTLYQLIRWNIPWLTRK